MIAIGANISVAFFKLIIYFGLEESIIFWLSILHLRMPVIVVISAPFNSCNLYCHGLKMSLVLICFTSCFWSLWYQLFTMLSSDPFWGIIGCANVDWWGISRNCSSAHIDIQQESCICSAWLYKTFGVWKQAGGAFAGQYDLSSWSI